jgi:hypothetical protein
LKTAKSLPRAQSKGWGSHFLFTFKTTLRDKGEGQPPKNKNRKDYTQATMAAMRQHAEKDPASNKNAKKAAS